MYRTEIGIIGKILELLSDSGREGVIISSLVCRANISQSELLTKCNPLIKSGLINMLKIKRTRKLWLTSSGREFHQELKRFQETLDKIPIRY